MDRLTTHDQTGRPTGLGTLSWLWQAGTGVLLVGLSGLHMIAHHFVVEGGLRTFADVQAYLAHPLILPLEVLFLVVVTAHALLGVRAILLDLGLHPATERRLTQLLWLLGLLTIAYGLWLTWTIITYPAT